MDSAGEVAFTPEDRGFTIAWRIIAWLLAALLPLAYTPASYDSVLLKLPVFTIFSGLLLALAGFSVLKREPRLNLLLISMMLITLGYTVLHHQKSLQGSIRILVLLSGASLVISHHIFRPKLRDAMAPLIAGGFVALAVSMISPGSGIRPSGLFGNANLMGSYAAGLLPVGAAFLFRSNRKGILLSSGFAAVCLAAVLATGTRSSLLAISAAAGAVFILRRNRKALNFLWILFFALSALLLFQHRLGVPQLDGSMGVRQVIWEGTSEIVTNNPLTGGGTGSFQRLFPSFRPPDFNRRGLPYGALHAHSEPLEILAENGVIGLLLWGVLGWILLRQSLNKACEEACVLYWGILAGVFVLLVESLTSVALRYTSSVFLFSSFAAFLSAGNEKRSFRLPRWSGVLLLCGGLFLSVAGTAASWKMFQSSVLLQSAINSGNTGTHYTQVENFCLESISKCSGEPLTWFLLGNAYSDGSVYVPDMSSRDSLLNLQLAAYDSLEQRVDDFAWAVRNSLEARKKLGMWDEALADVTHIYRTRNHLKSYAVDNGILICPAADVDNSPLFMARLHSNILAYQLQNAGSISQSDFSEPNSKQVLCTVLALASIHRPESTDQILFAVDSILAPLQEQTRKNILNGLIREVELAQEGYSMFLNSGSGLSQQDLARCQEVISDRWVYAPWHRAALLNESVTTGSGQYLDIAALATFHLNESLYPLADLLPLGTDVFPILAEISAASGEPEHLEILYRCLGYILEIDRYGFSVHEMLRQASDYDDQAHSPAFWRENGGPLYTGSLSPEGSLARLLNVPGAEDPEFQATLIFTTGSLAIAQPFSDGELITDQVIHRLEEIENLLADSLGRESAERLISTVISRQIEYLQDGAYPGSAAEAAQSLKARYLNSREQL